MARRRLADILPTSKILLNTPFGDEPSPIHFKFQAATGVLQRSQPENQSTQKKPFGLTPNGFVFQTASGVRISPPKAA